MPLAKAAGCQPISCVVGALCAVSTFPSEPDACDAVPAVPTTGQEPAMEPNVVVPVQLTACVTEKASLTNRIGGHFAGIKALKINRYQS
jgi:hypothetical protein